MEKVIIVLVRKYKVMWAGMQAWEVVAFATSWSAVSGRPWDRRMQKA